MMTPGQRNHLAFSNKELLVFSRLKKKSYKKRLSIGRNGKITTWHLGGGHKRLYREVEHFNGIVEGLEYDPNRNARISRIFHPDSHSHSYQLAITEIKRGDLSGNQAKLGHRLPLGEIPLGSLVSDLEGGYIRGAGTCGQLVQKTATHARVKLPSGKYKLFSLIACATQGKIYGKKHKLVKLGKAGRNRWLGRRPIVRGVAINPVDHPHGGGEGKTSGGRSSVTPWGKPTKCGNPGKSNKK